MIKYLGQKQLKEEFLWLIFLWGQSIMAGAAWEQVGRRPSAHISAAYRKQREQTGSEVGCRLSKSALQ